MNVEQLRVGYTTAKAKLDAANATLAIRQKEWDRASNLQQQGISAESSLDDSRLALQQAQSDVALAEQEVAGATAALAGNPDIAADDHPAVRAAMAARDNAQRSLDKTTVVAPPTAPSRRSRASMSASSSTSAPPSRRWSRPTTSGSRPISRKRS